MQLDPTEEQRAAHERARAFARDVVAPRAAAMEAAKRFDESVLTGLRDQGYFGLTIPRDYGGAGCGAVTSCLVIEELARASASVAILVSVHNAVSGFPIATFGNEEQKRRYLPALARGAVGGFCQTEAGAGSDPGSMTSTAVRDGDAYVLNGAKLFVTNGAIAEYFVVMAKTDPSAGKRGVTAFVVERSTAGLRPGPLEKKLAMWASDTVEIHFTDCRVPADARLGKEGEGMRIGMTTLDTGRLGVAAQAIGIAQGALDEALAHLVAWTDRGRDAGRVAAVQETLADMDTQLAAARLLTREAAWRKDQGLPFTLQAARAKLFAAEASHGITSRAIEILGLQGLSAGASSVERRYREARITEVYEGTSEIQRLVIARELLREAAR